MPFSLSRRSFLKTGASGLAALAIPSFIPEVLQASISKTLTGIQLYSVREAMGKDPNGTLKKLAEIGYKNVEHANYKARKFYGHSATEFKKLLEGLGLKMPSGHTSLSKEHWDEGKKDFTDLWKYTVEDAATVGQSFVISPWLDESYRKTYEDLLRYMEVFNRAGELCKKSGLRFAYHNHNFEFNTRFGDKTIYEIILDHTDKDLVSQQIDIGNMYGAGGRAIDIIKKYPGRFELMHVKDVILGTGGMDGYISTILGKGVLGTKSVTDYGKNFGGTHQFIIEQEEYQGLDPIDCANSDLQIIKSWGY